MAQIRHRVRRIAPLGLDGFERRDALAGRGFEPLAKGVAVVGDELGTVARAGDFYVEGFLVG